MGGLAAAAATASSATPPCETRAGALHIIAAAVAAGWLGLSGEARADEAELPAFSSAEVAVHGSEDDCWVIIDGFV